MEIDAKLRTFGFEAASSCSGFEWYAKKCKIKNRDALVTITDQHGTGLPESMDTPVTVEVVDLHSGDDIEAPLNYDALESYLETLEPI